MKTSILIKDFTRANKLKGLNFPTDIIQLQKYSQEDLSTLHLFAKSINNSSKNYDGFADTLYKLQQGINAVRQEQSEKRYKDRKKVAKRVNENNPKSRQFQKLRKYTPHPFSMSAEKIQNADELLKYVNIMYSDISTTTNRAENYAEKLRKSGLEIIADFVGSLDNALLDYITVDMEFNFFEVYKYEKGELYIQDFATGNFEQYDDIEAQQDAIETSQTLMVEYLEDYLGL